MPCATRIERVWASQRSARVLAYQAARRITLAGMGIIVQRQVRPRSPACCSRVSPTDRGRCCSSTAVGWVRCWCPGRSIPDGSSIAGPAAPRLWPLLDEPLPRRIPRPHEALCSTTPDREARTTCARHRATFGAPQDIEWTIDGDGTALDRAEPSDNDRATTGRTLHRPGRAGHWSNANVNENFPQPISPLLYSIARQGYYHYFRNLGRAFGVSRAVSRRWTGAAPDHRRPWRAACTTT